MNKKGVLFAAIGIIAFIIFMVYSIRIVNKPEILEVQGEVDATQIKVASKLVGRIDGLPIHKGDSVKKGQLLFTFLSPEIDAKMAQADAALLGAEAQNQKARTGAQVEDIEAANNIFLKAQAGTELAKKTFDRINNLYKDGVLPAQKRDEAETQFTAAKETENAAHAIWMKARNGTRIEDRKAASAMVARAEGAIDEVKSYRKETAIYSPIDGEISDIIAESGELVSAGFPVVTLVNLKDCWITFNLREDLLADIKLGSELQARFPALGNKMLNLKVTYIHNLGDFATWNATKTSGDFDMKTFEVHATPIDNFSGLRLGMSAIVNWDQLRATHKNK